MTKTYWATIYAPSTEGRWRQINAATLRDAKRIARRLLVGAGYVGDQLRVGVSETPDLTQSEIWIAAVLRDGKWQDRP